MEPLRVPRLTRAGWSGKSTARVQPREAPDGVDRLLQSCSVTTSPTPLPPRLPVMTLTGAGRSQKASVPAREERGEGTVFPCTGAPERKRKPRPGDQTLTATEPPSGQQKPVVWGVQQPRDEFASSSQANTSHARGDHSALAQRLGSPQVDCAGRAGLLSSPGSGAAQDPLPWDKPLLQRHSATPDSIPIGCFPKRPQLALHTPLG